MIDSLSIISFNRFVGHPSHPIITGRREQFTTTTNDDDDDDIGLRKKRPHPRNQFPVIMSVPTTTVVQLLSSLLLLLVVTWFGGDSSTTCLAFAPLLQPPPTTTTTSSPLTGSWNLQRRKPLYEPFRKVSTLVLQSTEGSSGSDAEPSGSGGSSTTDSSSSNESGDDGVVTEVTDSESGNAAVEEKEEDPEIKALKEETAELEATLKDKRRALSLLQDVADDYTKAGYARKVAEMENMRRTRRVRLSIQSFVLVVVCFVCVPVTYRACVACEIFCVDVLHAITRLGQITRNDPEMSFCVSLELLRYVSIVERREGGLAFVGV